MFEIGKLTRLPLGYVGESNSRTISIDISEWLQEFPGALVMIQVVRPVDRYKYPAAYTLADGVLHWTVDGAELIHAGKGLAQIILYAPDTKREYKSRVVGTVVAESLDGFNEIDLENSDPAQKWVNQVLESANSAEESAVSAKNNADRAESALEDAVGTVTQQKNEALLAIRTEGETQKNAIEAKGEETIASIPKDYTELETSVQNNVDNINAVSSNILPSYMVVSGVYINPSTKTLKNETGAARVVCMEGKANTRYVIKKATATIVRAGCGESADLIANDALVGVVARDVASDAPLVVETSGKYRYIYVQVFADSDSAELRSIEANIATMIVYDDTIGELDALRDTTENMVRYDVGENLFDPAQAMHGVVFRVDIGHDGDIDVRPDGMDTSGCFAAYVRLTGTGVYRMAASKGIYGSTVNRICTYDKDKQYLGFMTGDFDEERSVLTLTVDDDRICYIGYSNYIAQLYRTAMVVKDRPYPYAYIPFERGNDVLNGVKVNASDVVGIETYPGHVKSAWEQRMLERIDLAMLPTKALRKMAKAPNGYIGEGETMTGIVYSSVYADDRLVGTQLPLSTYYSALKNPASVMYTEDLYQDVTGISTAYGINCSGFVSYAYGFSEWVGTHDLAKNYKDNLLTIATENDLFQIRRGDLLINTIDSTGDGDHVKIVKDVVYDRATGRLAGFNVAESGKPYVRVTFMTPSEFLEHMSEAQPYYVARIPDADYGLDVPEIKYSQAVYPDRGDGGRYAMGGAVQLYIPDATASGITYTMGDQSVTMALSDMESAIVNDVTVYNLTGLDKGEYAISTDAAPDDPCRIVVV